jgi:hypothetical protein
MKNRGGYVLVSLIAVALVASAITPLPAARSATAECVTNCNRTEKACKQSCDDTAADCEGACLEVPQQEIPECLQACAIVQDSCKDQCHTLKLECNSACPRGKQESPSEPLP